MKRASTTSDGIPNDEWSRVHDLSLLYANHVMAGQSVKAESVRRSLLRALNGLGSTFGKRPSILATKAEYVKNTSLRRALLLEAFDVARRRRDKKNLTLIASSLAELFADEVGDPNQARHWIKELEHALSAHFDATEAGVLETLKERFG